MGYHAGSAAVQDRPQPGPVGAAGVRRRRANVLGVYAPASPEQTAGKRILLVDDICTTGATLMECARVLREAGAEDVICAAVALTPLEKGTGGPKNA